jgi:hypothetical protein
MILDSNGFKVDARSGWIPLPHPVVLLRDVAWRCLEIMWCRHYSRIQCLKPQYLSYDQYAAHVSHFWLCPKYFSIVVHYQRLTPLCRLCVSSQPPKRVYDRNGYHARNGHVVTLCFGEGGLVRMKCFDEECRRSLTCGLGDPLPFQLPRDVRMNASAGFNALTNGGQ